MSKSLAQLLPKIARKTLKSGTTKQAVVWQNWRHIFGDLADQIEPHKITKTPGGTLMVKTDSATALQLQYGETQILEKIAMIAGHGEIVRIKTIKGVVTRKSTRQQAQPLTPKAETLDQALENLGKVLE